MDLTILPSKKTVAQWESRLLVIAQGNAVIELTPDQATELLDFIQLTLKPASFFRHDKKDLGV